MWRPRVSLEWHVAEDDADWEKMAFAPTPLTEVRTPLRHVTRCFARCLLRWVRQGLGLCLQ